MSTALLFDFIALGILFFVLKAYIGRQTSNLANLPYPPGPTPLPVLGNLLDFPQTFIYKAFAAWKEQYGELIHLTVLGGHILVINSERVAVDLLEKRSRKYSDRPDVPIVHLTGWDWNMALRRYDDGWRQRRREFHQHFRADKIAEYHPAIMKNATAFLGNLLQRPEDFAAHIRHYLGATIMSVVYDYDVAPTDDRFIHIVEEAVGLVSEEATPTMAVNVFPILQYLPAWLPGMGFKRMAERCKRLTKEMRDAPMDFVRARMEAGVSSACVAAELINRLSDSRGTLDAESEDVVKDVSAIAYAAGADTTSTAIKTSLLAMVLYPEVKEKAQREIDAVIGNKRLPVLEDRDSLPYVEAFFREVLRWNPVLPISLAHATCEDDVYEGQFIPKGTTVIMNTWAIHHDGDVYPEPYTFKPERFLNTDGSISDRYPTTVFGMGRRLCPGRHLASATVWTAIVLVLAAFDVDKAVDGSTVWGEYKDGLVAEPVPFVCKIEGRSKLVESLIREACADIQK